MTILDEIVEVKKEEVKKLRKEFTLSRFSDFQFFESEPMSLHKRISSDKNLSIIAEIKKASPSKGIIRENFNHTDIAKIYFENEVSGISVLTDNNFFKGSIEYLNSIAKIKSAPLLRKDFIIDEYQVYEAKANGADVILLICEILSEEQVRELTHAANELNLEVLLELHSEEQLNKVDFEIHNIVGINNRNLKTFEVDINNSIDICKQIPRNVCVVAESGFSDKTSVDKVKNEKIDALLVGEHFMRAENISDELRKFKDWCNRES
ncbi:MAG: indole-3-glycerol phosphate synthase TrpC [Ignavibacteriales bacterium]|jgi:indole-3-glycerol phosphate synthase|nr:MAG: indole-3-glycerol phosphate synthase TrpC [Ignavibacteriales bacterium]